MGNIFVKSAVKQMVNDPEIMEPLAATVKQVITDKEVISAAGEITTDPNITNAIDAFRQDIVKEMQLARVEIVDQLKLDVGEIHLAREQVMDQVDQLKLGVGEIHIAREQVMDQEVMNQGLINDQMKSARRDGMYYVAGGIVVALGVAVAFYKLKSTSSPSPPPTVDLIPVGGTDGLEGAPNDGLKVILFKADPKIFREVKFALE